jgi:GABA(A) receptor-associated protein
MLPHQNMQRFKDTHPFAKRKAEADRVREKYTDRVPVICEENGSKSTNKSKVKFLVPNDLTVAQFIFVVRQRIQLTPTEAIFLFLNATNMTPSSQQTMVELYHAHKDEDGFLYLVWSRENTFGGNPWLPLLSLIAIVFLGLCWVWKNMVPPVFEWQGDSPGPTCLIIAGTHGNETAIVPHLPQWMVTPACGKIILISPVHPSAYWLQSRTSWDNIDVNRCYPNESNEYKSQHWINHFLDPYLRQADFILDFHEGAQPHRFVPTSMGCAVWPTQHPFSRAVAAEIGAQLERHDPRWSIGTWSPQTQGKPTLREYVQTLQKPYVLIELCREDSIETKGRAVRMILHTIHNIVLK